MDGFLNWNLQGTVCWFPTTQSRAEEDKSQFGLLQWFIHLKSIIDMFTQAKLCCQTKSILMPKCQKVNSTSLSLSRTFSAQSDLYDMCWLPVPTQWKRLRLAEHHCYKEPGRRPKGARASAHPCLNTPICRCIESMLELLWCNTSGCCFFNCNYDKESLLNIH